VLSPNSKLLILARHPESTKNLETLFSTSDGNEVLTDHGASQAIEFAVIMNRTLEILNVPPDRCCVASSTSLRARGTAESAASAIGSHVVVDRRLNAISAGALAGVEEVNAHKVAPRFVDDLELYRAGVFNSYRLSGYGEDVRDFETRIKASLVGLLATDFQVVAIVAHRSSITASLIVLARLSLGYPESFYGYIPLELGNLSAAFVDLENVAWVGINLSPKELNHRLLLRQD
jgi:broad specificity phosphatase PhoE